MAMLQLYFRANRQSDADKRAQMLKKYIYANYTQSYQNKFYAWRAYAKLFKYYADRDSLKQMKRIAKLWLHPNPRKMKNPRKANDYNAAAMFLAKDNEHYDWALQLAKKALKLSKKEPVANTHGFKLTKYGIQLAYLPKKKAEKQRKYRNANILANMGLIYLKQKKYKKAEATLKKAIKTSSESIDAKKYLASVYEKTNHPKKTFEIYKTLLITRPHDTSYLKKLKKSYIAYNGSKKGLKNISQIYGVKHLEKRKLIKRLPRWHTPSI